MKVLLVDDDDAIVTIFTAALNKEGFQTVSAADGKTGLDRAKAEKPDFILLDQVLPDIPGNEVLKTLKDDPETKNIPVAMVSNYTFYDQMKEAINIGAVDYILKYQIEPNDLVQKIKDLSKDTQSPAAV
jgi:two-component system, OmpR family, alkaline phosphatase synthesis response regulator PhoP